MRQDGTAYDSAEDIQIAAEDDADDGGPIANSDCGRKWHSGCWSNVGEAAKPDC